MAMTDSSQFGTFSTPDIEQAVTQLERERTLKKVAVIGSVGLVVLALGGVAYLNFGQSFDPGPPRAETTPAHYGETGFVASGQ